MAHIAVLLTATALSVALGVSHAVFAGDPDPEVLRVGDAAMSRTAVERRLARLPSFQRDALGTTAGELRRSFVESVLVPELMYGEEARHRKLEQSPAHRLRIDEVYHRVLADSLHAEVLAARPVTDEEVAGYRDAHAKELETEERVRIWRILVDDESSARVILDAARGSGGPERWRALAREHSRDTATRLRGGDLGFVAADGTTDLPELRVEEAVVRAARAVRDGEVAPEPVREGARFAVVWRRGTRPASAPSAAELRPFIEQTIVAQRALESLNRLVADLRARFLRDYRADALAALPKGEQDALLLRATGPRSAASLSAAGAPAARSAGPDPGPAGLR